MNYVNHEGNGYRQDFGFAKISLCTDCVFHILQEVGVERKSTHLRYDYLRLEWCVVMCGSKNGTPKRRVFK